MKIFCITTALAIVAFLFGCNFATRSNAASENTFDNSALSSSNDPVSPLAVPTPKTKATAKEALPEKVDDETAYSPVYDKNSKSCKNHDDDATEGEEFVRECKGYGKFTLWVFGSTGNINYRIDSGDPNGSSPIYLFPLEDGDASEYVRADKYSQKLGNKIEWRLDEKGKPYAIIVRAFFYKNVGAKTFSNPKNKVAEFLLVRGLAGYEGLKADIQTKDTAYNPNEWARKVAYEFIENK